jgi:DHA1 family tetracycline resistance protein-like MFS transporter
LPSTTSRYQPATLFIFITVALDILAIGVVIPVLPTLIAGFFDNAADGAVAFGWFVTVFAIAQFFASPILGALSDRFGRRPVILASNLGLGLDYILLALAQTLPLLFLARVISGITSASIATAYAYIADVTPAERRAASYGTLGAAFGLGFVFGPALGGVLGDIDPRLPFWVAAGLSLANFVYGWLILPESHPPERRRPFAWASLNPLNGVLWLRQQSQLLGLATVAFLAGLSHIVYPTTFVLYATWRYGWDAGTIGVTLAVVGICSAIVQGGLVRRVVPKIGEWRALLLGLSGGIVAFIGFGSASSAWLLWAFIPISALMGFVNPSAQALMTSRVDATEQGRLQGAVAGLTALAGLIGPWTFTHLYAVGIDPAMGWHVPGAAFYAGAAALAVALGVVWVMRQGSGTGKTEGRAQEPA